MFDFTDTIIFNHIWVTTKIFLRAKAAGNSACLKGRVEEIIGLLSVIG